MPPRNYSTGDRAALILLGKGKCYWGSGCTEPLLKQVEEKYRLNLQIAHIRSDKEGAQRYVPNISPEDVDAFSNLIFLCKPHHEAIDEPGAELRFTVETLETWKQEREGYGYEEGLQGLREVSEEDIVERIAQAAESQSRDIRDTLARLEQSDAEAAALMRELRDEIEALRRSGSVLDPDMVSTLDSAADRLERLPDHAGLLYDATENLGNVETYASMLSSATANLNQISDVVEELNAAAMRMQDMR